VPETDRYAEADVDIAAYVGILWRRKWLFAAVVTVVLIGAFVRTMYLRPEMWGSATTIIPHKEADGGALGLLRQAGGAAAALAGLGVTGGGDTERLSSFLRTRSLAERVARRHRLFGVLTHRQLNELREKRGPSFGELDLDRIRLELAAAHPAGVAEASGLSPGSAILALDDATVLAEVTSLPGWAGNAAGLDVRAARQSWYQLSQAMLGKFREGVRVESDRKDSIIRVVVMFEDNPTLAADLANSFVDELRTYLRTTTNTEARRTREFVEARYMTAVSDLAAAEAALEAFETQHTLVSLPEQTAQAVSRLGALEATLAAKRVERDVLTGARVSPGSAALAAIDVQIDAAEEKLALALRGEGSAVSTMALADLPRVKRELAELMRARVVQETLFTLLAQQLEIAKIDETREEVAFETLDPAMPAIERSSPRRKVDMVIGLAIGCVMGALCVALVELWSTRRQRAASAGEQTA